METKKASFLHAILPRHEGLVKKKRGVFRVFGQYARDCVLAVL